MVLTTGSMSLRLRHETRFPLMGPTVESLRLADQLASAWVSLAATGFLNNPRTPEWPTYDVRNRTTMVFGEPSSAVNDPRRPVPSVLGEGRDGWCSARFGFELSLALECLW